jgi:Zn-dependent M28 family amino/carboxypeptidase
MANPGNLDERLRRHVQVLAAEIGERHVWRAHALHAAADYIRGQFKSLGYAVAPQAYEVYGVRCENLEVTIPGSSRPGEILLAGAHYDTVEGSPGADDNASGIAGLIEIARLLREARPQRTVKLVAFVNEESPFFHSGAMGSAVYARAARRRGDDIRLMLSLEMLGCYRDEPRSQAYPPFLKRFYPERGNFIAFVSNLRSRRALAEFTRAFRAASDFPCERLAAPALVPGLSWSDHLSFWRAGYRALMATDTAFYRYAHYHQPTDTPGRLRYPEMARVVEGLARALQALAAGA